MKAILTSIYAVVCIVIIGISHFYWTEKTTASQNEEQKNKSGIRTVEQMEDFNELISYTKNWPAEAVESFKLALKEDKPFKIVIAGSPALGGDSGWAQQTKASLLDTFGKEHVTVELREYDLNSKQFIAEEKHLELAKLNGDMILFEPFILENNGVLTIDNTLADLSATIEAVKQNTPETVFILQPSYPVFQATIYPKQVGSLKQYAEENGIAYLDHWTVWPDSNSQEIIDYLSEDEPSEKGHELWGNFVCDYLISK